MEPRLESRFAGCLIGQCLGDASGFMVEGYGPDLCRSYVEECLRAGKVKNWKRGRFPFGQYSDDSQRARELIQSFVACRKFAPADFALRVAAIFTEDRIVGRGRATEEAARRLAQGINWEEAGTPSPSAGNGSAMRAAPIGLFFLDDPEQMIKAAHDQSRITHQDMRCSAGAIAIAGATALLLREDALDLSDFTTQLSEWTRAFDPILSDAIEQLPDWILSAPETAATHISKVGFAAGYSDRWEGISPFVTGSVLWSLYSFLRTPDDYWETICTAIAVGGDVDTTAAMAGAISGTRVGLENLPSELTRCLNDNGTWKYDELLALAHNCFKLKTGGNF